MITTLERRRHNICKHAERAVKDIDMVIARLAKVHSMAHGAEVPCLIAQAIQDLNEVRCRVLVISNQYKMNREG